MTAQNYSNLVVEKINDKQKILTDDTDQKTFTIIELKQPIQYQKKNGAFHYATWISVILIILSVVYFLLIKNHFLNSSVVALEDWLKQIYEKSPFQVYFIIYLIINCVIIFCIGSHSVFCVITALVIKNPFLAFLILFISSVSGDSIVFVISKKFLRNRLVSKFKSNEFFGVLLEESKNEPFKTAFLTRLLFIPAGIKNYILSAIDNKASSYFISGMSLHAFYIIESVLIAQELGEIEDLLNRGQHWSDKSTIEKISFIFVMCFVIFTVIFIFVLGAWARKKIINRKQRVIELDLKVG